MPRRILLASIALAVVATAGAGPDRLLAQEEEESRWDPWDMSAEFSFSDQSGNRDLRTFSGGLNLSHRHRERFRFDVSYQSRLGRSEGETVARNHSSDISFELDPRGRWSPFLSTDLERDPFKRLDLRANTGAGANFNPFRETEVDHDLSISLALQHSYEQIRPTEEDAGRSRTTARWNLRVNGSQDVGASTTVRYRSDYQPVWNVLDDYLLRTQTSLRQMLTERLALSLTYELRRNAVPPEGVDPDDRTFRTSLIVSF